MNAVVRAYGELESAGLIVNRRGSGATVAAPSEATASTAEADVAAATARLAATATAAHMTTDRVIDLVRAAMVAAGSAPATGQR